MGINKEGYQLVYDDSIRNHPSLLHCIQIKYPKMIKEIPLSTPPPPLPSPLQQPQLQQRQEEEPEYGQELDMITLDSGNGDDDDFLNSNNKNNNKNNISSLNCDHLNEVVSLKKLDFELSPKNIVSSEEELDCTSSNTINDIHSYLNDADMNTVSNPITPSKLDDDLFEQSLFRLAEQQEQQQQQFPMNLPLSSSLLPLAPVFTTPPTARPLGIEQPEGEGGEEEVVFTASELQFILEETAIFSPPPPLSLTTEVEEAEVKEQQHLQPVQQEENNQMLETSPQEKEVEEEQLIPQQENSNTKIMEISPKEQEVAVGHEGDGEGDIVLEDLLPSYQKVTQPDDWYWFEQQEPLHEAEQVEEKEEKQLEVLHEKEVMEHPMEISETEKKITINSPDQSQFPVSDCLKNEGEEVKIEPVFPNSSSSAWNPPHSTASASSHAVFPFPTMPDDWYWSSSSLSANNLVLNNNCIDSENREDRNHQEAEELNHPPKKKMKTNQENTSGETSFSPYFPNSLRVEIKNGYFKRITRSTSTATDKQ
jgi:hypothetical protein